MNSSPPKSLRVHWLHTPEPEALADLNSRLDHRIALSYGPAVDAKGAGVHVLIAGRPAKEQLAACGPELRSFIIPWAGIPEPTRQLLLTDFPHLTVHNLHHNAASTAELAVALLLTCAKQIIPIDREFRMHHDWSARYESAQHTIVLDGLTALVLGYGAIGRRVARMCLGLGMRVNALRRSLDEPMKDGPVQVYPAAHFHDLLPGANALMVCLPHTPETDGLIGATELTLLPARAIVCNVSRGPIIDERALYEALKNNTLHGAGLDVWYIYPKSKAEHARTEPAHDPFHELDNVVMSPHRGGALDAPVTEAHRMNELAQVLNALAAGDTSVNRVSLERGY